MPIFENSTYLSYDDVLLLPGYADFSRGDIDLSTKLTKNIKLAIPLASSPMDTVTEHKLAIKLAELGGIGFIHRNLSINEQANQVHKVKQKKLLVGAAIGASTGYQERIKALIKAQVDVVIVDTAHGFVNTVIQTIQSIKKTYPNLDIIGGNIATSEGAEALIQAGCDALRVGMGPGAICTTRIVSGMGVPQLTAVVKSAQTAAQSSIPVIADGGIKYSGDMVKALAAGASTVMMGSFFSSASEAPGEIVALDAEQVPARFKNILRPGIKNYHFKQYRGMGSVGAMEKGAQIKSEDEYHGKSYKDRVLVAEGVEGLVPVNGNLESLVEQSIGGIKSGMYYIGAKTIRQLQNKARFIMITQASLTESHPHDILITNPGKSYS